MTTAGRRAVAAAFALNGLCFATLASRVPDVRAALGLSNGSLGLLLLSAAAGSVVGLPLSGHLIDRTDPGFVVRLGAWLVSTGLVVAAIAAATGSVLGTAVGLVAYGAGTGMWDVAMNVSGAAIERLEGRSVLPRFHAVWSFGTFAGAGIGAGASAARIPLPVHVTVMVTLALAAVLAASRRVPHARHESEAPASGRSAWLEPRTVAIGLMVLAFTLAEGSANDWLALALVDGYAARHWVGVLGLATFVAAMVGGRLLGPVLLDRLGRLPVLLGSAVAALVGVLLVVWGGRPAVAVVGILLWGLGAALGFPVGMSAAADDPARAARRVSVVSTVGYGAFLAGPPLLGFVADRVGTLSMLLVVAAAMLPAAVLALAVRRPASPDSP